MHCGVLGSLADLLHWTDWTDWTGWTGWTAALHTHNFNQYDCQHEYEYRTILSVTAAA